MGRFAPWRRVPGPAAALVRPGERLLAWAPVVDGAAGVAPPGGAWAVATAQALYAPVPAGTGAGGDGAPGRGVLRLPWHRVATGAWDPPVLAVAAVDGGPALRLVLGDPGELPAVLRERVESTVVARHRLADPGADAVARQDSETGQVRWTVTLDAGLDASDPAVRARASAALAALRADLGV